MKVSILEDEEDIASLIKHNLEKEGFIVNAFFTPESFFDELKNNPFDLLILDLMLPSMNGLEILKVLRSKEEFKNKPVIILTARSTEGDKVLGLDMGADDYVTKPFSVRELIARVKAILRRTTKEEKNEILSAGGIKLDLSSFQLFIDNEPVEVTKTELQLLKILIEKPGKVFSRDELLDKLWGDEKCVVDRTIDVHIKKIRDKLGTYSNWVKTVRGVGYFFEMV